MPPPPIFLRYILIYCFKNLDITPPIFLRYILIYYFKNFRHNIIKFHAFAWSGYSHICNLQSINDVGPKLKKKKILLDIYFIQSIVNIFHIKIPRLQQICDTNIIVWSSIGILSSIWLPSCRKNLKFNASFQNNFKCSRNTIYSQR